METYTFLKALLETRLISLYTPRQSEQMTSAQSVWTVGASVQPEAAGTRGRPLVPTTSPLALEAHIPGKYSLRSTVMNLRAPPHEAAAVARYVCWRAVLTLARVPVRRPESRDRKK